MGRHLCRCLAILSLVSGGACKSEQRPEERPVRPPAPPTAAKLPPELLDRLPRTDGGLPILFQVEALVPGLRIALVFDETRDDPITRWGECLSRITDCYQTNEGRLGGCVDMIEVCPDDRGGTDCCAPVCIAQYKALLAAGKDENTAVRESFMKGDCVEGLAAQRQRAQSVLSGRVEP